MSIRCPLEEYHEDGDVEAFLIALRNIAEAKGGISVQKEEKLDKRVQSIPHQSIISEYAY